MNKKTEKKGASLLPYEKPAMRIEKINASFFRGRSMKQEEIEGFNLLAATDTTCDDY